MFTYQKIYNLFVRFLTAKPAFILLTFIFINCISRYGTRATTESENVSEENFTYNEYLRNDSVEILDFDQSVDSFNISNNATLGNLTDESNSTSSVPIVTENWQNSDKVDQNQRYLSFTTSDEDICSCDLNTNVCDINCCCDPDCNEEDIKVFSRCHIQALTPDPNYCYQKDIIFRNNTVYKMEKDPESSLFCIIHDNLKQHLRFKELPVIKSHRDLDVLLKYQSKYISSWDDDQHTVESVWKELRAGNPIYVDSNSKKQKSFENHWSLPSPCFTRMCSCNQEVKYLEDFSSSCSRHIANLKEECETNAFLSADSYANFCLKSSSMGLDLHSRLNDLIAHTKAIDSGDGLHHQSDQLCVEKRALKPKYSPQQALCSNIVSAVHFTVIHNGFDGIHSINASFEYTNVDSKSELFLQHFSVVFKWNNITDTIKRSGNPGYQVDLPILIGTNNTAMESDEVFEIKVDPRGLSVLDRDANSLCSSKRKTVKFGKNLKTSCIFPFSKWTCKDLQERILSILLGSSKKQVFVGVFGNANDSNVDDWIEAYHEDHETPHTNKTCPVILSLKINIVYADVGTVVNPQSKILGVGYHYGKPHPVDLSCSSCPDLKISTSVSFFDVTEPAIPHYPKVPSIKANLPSDFFYPFLYGKATKNTCTISLVIFQILFSLLLK